MKRLLTASAVVALVAASCDFDADYATYCEETHRCPRDAGVDGGLDAGLDGGPDAGPDAGIDAGADGGAGSGRRLEFALDSGKSIYPTECTQFSVLLLEADGGPAPAGSVSVTSSGDAGLGIYLNPVCSSPAGTLTGSNVYSLHASAARAGSATLSASSAGFTAATRPVNITATRLVFSSPEQNVKVTVCSALVAIELRDATNDDRVPFPSATQVQLSSDAGIVFSLSSPSCSPVDGGILSVPKGALDAGFYFSSAIPADVTITADAGALGLAVQTSYVGRDHLSWYQVPNTPYTGGCYDVGVERLDAGNTSYDGYSDVALSATPPGCVKFSAGRCDAGSTAEISSIVIDGGSYVDFSATFGSPSAYPCKLIATAAGFAPAVFLTDFRDAG